MEDNEEKQPTKRQRYTNSGMDVDTFSDIPSETGISMVPIGDMLLDLETDVEQKQGGDISESASPTTYGVMDNATTGIRPQPHTAPPHFITGNFWWWRNGSRQAMGSLQRAPECSQAGSNRSFDTSNYLMWLLQTLLTTPSIGADHPSSSLGQVAHGHDISLVEAESLCDALGVILHPNKYDIILGSGQPIRDHPGTKRYRSIIKQNASQYLAANTNFEKRKIAATIQKEIEKVDFIDVEDAIYHCYKARFLKRTDGKELYEEVTDNQKITKKIMRNMTDMITNEGIESNGNARKHLHKQSMTIMPVAVVSLSNKGEKSLPVEESEKVKPSNPALVRSGRSSADHSHRAGRSSAAATSVEMMVRNNLETTESDLENQQEGLQRPKQDDDDNGDIQQKENNHDDETTSLPSTLFFQRNDNNNKNNNNSIILLTVLLFISISLFLLVIVLRTP